MFKTYFRFFIFEPLDCLAPGFFTIYNPYSSIVISTMIWYAIPFKRLIFNSSSSCLIRALNSLLPSFSSDLFFNKGQGLQLHSWTVRQKFYPFHYSRFTFYLIILPCKLFLTRCRKALQLRFFSVNLPSTDLYPSFCPIKGFQFLNKLYPPIFRNRIPEV